MGLRSKLAASFLLLLIATVMAIGAIQIDRTASLMIDQLAKSGALLAGQVSAQIQTSLDSSSDRDATTVLRNDKALGTLLASYREFSDSVVYALLESPDGSTIASAPPPEAASVRPLVLRFDTLSIHKMSWFDLARVLFVRSDTVYQFSRPITYRGAPVATIRIGLSTALAAAELRHSARMVVAFAAIAVALGIAGAMVLGGTLLRPVAAIASGVDELAGSIEDDRIRVTGRDELGTLAEKFNQLSERLNRDRSRWETERGQLFRIFRSITDAVLLLDSSGAILFANAEATARLGLPAGGITNGKHLSLLIGRNNPLTRMIDAVYATGTEVHDVALQLGDSSSDRLLVSMFSLGNTRDPAGLLVIVRNLEPVRQLESVVDQSDRLAQLGALVSGIAHQVRDPLNAMNLQLELLTQDAEARRPLQDRLEAVRGEMRRVDEAVYALTRFVRPQSLHLEAVDLPQLIHEIGSRVQRQQIAIAYELDQHAECVTADRALLGEAIRNIASNAADSMPEGGTITIRSVMVADSIVEIVIIDHGQGIPAEHLNSVTQLYFTTKSNGTGLGLALAMRAIDLQRGTIEVNSKVGRGTAVTIRMPVHPHPVDALAKVDELV
jgi:signal transduction histidine kinase/HAMP domain-containing protein